ncbi:MAG: hypothetical protein CM15mP85_17920 [Rhodobacterales bacterium]|nr:MAG: hypothetical protein CM15mP85_17920 [Rhodobacterales bacterium]
MIVIGGENQLIMSKFLKGDDLPIYRVFQADLVIM